MRSETLLVAEVEALKETPARPTKDEQLTLFDDHARPERQARNDIRLGDAAEAFVIAKLLKAGFDAHGARRDAPYDVGVDLGNGRYCRIQVKGREQARRERWEFRFLRGNPRTGTGSYAYKNTDFDITACVALTLERVLFFPGVHASIRLSTADFLHPDSETDSWTRALNVFNRNIERTAPWSTTRSFALT